MDRSKRVALVILAAAVLFAGLHLRLASKFGSLQLFADESRTADERASQPHPSLAVWAQQHEMAEKFGLVRCLGLALAGLGIFFRAYRLVLVVAASVVVECMLVGVYAPQAIGPSLVMVWAAWCSLSIWLGLSTRLPRLLGTAS